MKTKAIREALNECLRLGGLNAVPKVVAAVAELTAVETADFVERNPWVVTGPGAPQQGAVIGIGGHDTDRAYTETVMQTKGERPASKPDPGCTLCDLDAPPHQWHGFAAKFVAPGTPLKGDA